jgi:hypothetical protein
MSSPTLWKITCVENEIPGLWRKWLMHQCVTVGYPPAYGLRMVGGETWRGWIVVRNALNKIKPDDLIVVALPGRRVGRIGKVLSKFIDRWEPLVVGDKRYKKGEEQGRRIFVRWEHEFGAPDAPDLVAQLPASVDMGRGALTRVNHHKIEWFREVIANQANWVRLIGLFGYERSLSEYIASYPYMLKSGLVPYTSQRIPIKKIREYVFEDGSRADVLLRDRDTKPVIVECKQESPDEEAIGQVRRYIKRLKDKTGEQASGILVHGGAGIVDKKVWIEAKKFPRVEIIHYDLKVDFLPSAEG